MIDEKKLIKEIRNMVLPLTIPEVDDGTTLAYNEALVDVLTAIEEQPKVEGWIPVEERLPDFGEIVLVTYIGLTSNKEFSGKMAFLNYNGDWYWNSDRYIAEIVRVKITAWMPLPEPYVKGDVEQ